MFGSRNLRRPLTVLLAASAMSFAMPALTAGALSSAISFTASTKSPAQGTTLDLTTIQPVTQAGSQTGTIIDQIDPTKLLITDPSTQVVAPTGWDVTFSSDGTSYAPYDQYSYNPYDVRYVKASGPIDAQGVKKGRVINTATDTKVAPSMSSIGAGGSGGDGWDVVVDPSSGDFYNLYHHDGAWNSGFSTGALDCHSRSTGQECPGAWPFAITNLADANAMHTSSQPYEYIDAARHHLWFPTATNFGAGFGCIDLSDQANPQWCGGSQTSGFVRTGNGGFVGRESMTGMAVAGSKIFSFSPGLNALECVDISANSGGGAPCANQPISLSGISAPSGSWSSLLTVGGKVMAVDAGRYLCIDPSDLSPCSGWSSNPWPATGFSTNGLTNSAMAFPAVQADGSITGMCVLSANAATAALNAFECIAPSGASITPDSGLTSAMAAKINGGVIGTAKPFVNLGSKVFFNSVFAGGAAYCYDVAAQNWCSGWGSSAHGEWSMYTVSTDPTNPHCLWTNGDQSGIQVLNTDDGSAGCPASGPSQVTFDDQVLIPRLSCSGSSITAWQTFKLVDPVLGDPNGAASATLTLEDSSGNPLSGWTDVSIPQNGIINISGLNVSDTGQSPRITVNFTDRSPLSIDTTAKMTAVSDQPELCIHPAVDVCPQNSDMGVIPAVPASTTQVTTTSSMSGVGSPQTSSKSIDLHVGSAPVGSCGGVISGTATRPDASPVAGARVQLLGYWGPDPTPILDADGHPVEAITAADGTYRFSGIAEGYYDLRFRSVDAQTTLVSITVPDWSDTTPATSSELLVGGFYFGGQDSTFVVDASFTGPGSLPPGPPTDLGFSSTADSAIVTWAPPLDDGGSPVTSYTVVTSDRQTCTVQVGDPLTCTFSGYTSFDRPTFEFYATNANGNSYPVSITGEIGGFAGATANTQLEVLDGELYSSTDLANWTDLGTMRPNTNALAYEPADGFAYALDNNPVKHLLRISSDGQYEVAGKIINQAGILTAGAIDPSTGTYYVTEAGGRLFRVEKVSAKRYRLVKVATAPGLWIGADFSVDNGVLTSVAKGKVFTWTIGDTSHFAVGTPIKLGVPCVIGAMWQDPTDGVDFRLNTSKTIYHLGDINLGGGGVPGPQVSVLANGNGGVPDPVDGASVVAAQGSPVSFS